MRALAMIALMTSPAWAADLNIYTYDSFNSEWGPGPQIEKEFEAECNCDIEFTPAGDGAAMLTRLRIEGEKTHADLVLGLDQNLAEQAIETGLFEDLALEPQEIAGADLTWENSYFAAYDWGQFAFIYNSEKTKTPPASLDELAKDDLKVIIEDPRASTPGLGLALWVYDVYGEKAADYWAELKDNIVTVTPGWSEAYSLFLEGESDMVLSYTTSPAYHRIADEEEQYRAAKFDEGHGLQIELLGMAKTSEHKDLAREFMAFLQKDKAQAALMNANWMYPVAGLEMPEGFDAPEGFKSLPPQKGENEAALKAFEEGMK